MTLHRTGFRVPIAVVLACACLGASGAWAQRPGWEKTRIDLTLRNTDINAALQLLTEMAGLNIVSGPEVKGTVSLRLEQVPLGEALNAILVVNGFGFVEGENLIKILPLQQIGRAITQTYSLNYASAAGLESSLKAFVSETGSVKGDDGSNTLIVTDVPDNLRKIGQLVEQLDRKPFQVLIEAHVIDLKVEDMTEFGVDWGLVNYDNPRSYVNLITAPDPEKLGEVRFGIIRNRYDLDALLRMIQEISSARILSSPRVVTLNHKLADIVVGQEVPYVSVTTDEEGNRQVTTEFRKVGTILRATPHVTHDGNVVLNLHPEQSFVTDWVQNVPVIDTRSATTEMLLGSGQTAVIGGLRKSDEVVAESRVPILGSIPILGNLFRSKRTSRTDVELMVLVTPYILQGDEIVVQDQTPLTSDQARAAYGKLQATYDDMKTQDGMAPVETGAGAEVTQ